MYPSLNSLKKLMANILSFNTYDCRVFYARIRTIKYSHYPWIFLLFLHKTWLIVGFLPKIFQITTLVAKKKNDDVFAFVKGFLSMKQKHERIRWAPWAVRQAVITVKHNRPSFRPMKYLEPKAQQPCMDGIIGCCFGVYFISQSLQKQP